MHDHGQMHVLFVDKIYYSQKLITQKYFLIEDTLKLFPKPAVIIDDLLGAPWKGEGVTVFTV